MTKLLWMPTYTGGCHCGSLSLCYTTGQEAADVRPRACDCSFCTRHAASYVSDPSGRLELNCGEHLQRYRQGEERADFLICGRCGVLLAVTHENLGAVNARCLDQFGGFGQPQAVSPQKLSAEEKLARWRANWTPLR